MPSPPGPWEAPSGHVRLDVIGFEVCICEVPLRIAGGRMFERVHSPIRVVSLKCKNIKQSGNVAFAEWISKTGSSEVASLPAIEKEWSRLQMPWWEPDHPGPTGQEVGTWTLELGEVISNPYFITY